MSANSTFVAQVDVLLTRIPEIEAGGHVRSTPHGPGWLDGLGGVNQPAYTEQVMEYNEVELRRFVSDINILVGTVISDKTHTIVRQAKRLENTYSDADVLTRSRALLQSLRDNLLNGNIKPESSADMELESDDADYAVATVERVVAKLHEVIVSLRHRHDGRCTLEIDDEYDVQDLLRSLLLIHFDDVRDEEWTPSTGTASSRVDLLIKRHQVAIETKMTRRSLSERKLVEDLAQDITLFPGHPDCKRLIIVIYDPDSRLRNPASLRDLESRGSIPVRVLVSPRR